MRIAGLIPSARTFLAAFLLTAISAALAACSVLGGLDSFLPGNAAIETSIRNASYGPSRAHRLDVYAPRERTAPLPVVIFFYGGGFAAGSKAAYDFAGQGFAQRSFVTVIPDYRFSTYPDFLDDGGSVIAWVRANAARIGADPNRIMLVGHSTGGYVAAMLALDQARLTAAGVPPHAIAGWAGLAGLYLFDPAEGGPISRAFNGVADPALVQPLRLIDPGDPPGLLATGSSDGVVSPQHTRMLAEAMLAAGVYAHTRTYEGMGHVGIAAGLANPFGGGSAVLDETAAFLHALPGRTPPAAVL